jgi:hypothetical protein
MTRLTLTLVVAGSFGMLACGSDDGPSPADKCNTFQTTYAGHLIDCWVDLACIPSAERDAQYNELLSSLQQQLPACSRTVSVKPSYDECLSTVKSTSCTAFAGASTGECMALPLPASCTGVIQIQ